MLAAPVGRAGPPDFPAIVWPLEALINDNATIGFVTAVVSHEQAVSFDAASRARWPYDQRLRAAASLAETMAEAHAARHWLSGLDPATIFVRPSGDISISDCAQVRPWDAKTKRQLVGPQPPSHLCAPEVKRRVDDVDETQDRYALAVLIYQMLADGAAPVSAGRYAHDNARGEGGGWYGKWPVDLRDLFDRALGARAKRKDRPSALEWAEALRNVSQRARICDVKPVEHGAAILASGGACAMCELSRGAPPPTPARGPTINAGAETGELARFSVDELPPIAFSVRAAPTPRAAEPARVRIRTPGAATPVMDASAPELTPVDALPSIFDWRVAGAILAITVVISGIVGAAAYFITPPGQLLADGAAPSFAADEAPSDTAANDRMTVRPLTIGEPVLNDAMLTATTSGYADIEFTVRNDGAASSARIAGESTPNLGYGAEALRLVSNASWPARWESRSAPYPARYRVVFPAGQTLTSQAPQFIVAPVYLARPQYSPQIVEYGRNASVTLAVRINARGGVENARVVRNTSQNQAIAQEALRLAMGARYPPDPSGAGYETRLDVNFEVSPELGGDGKPGEVAMTGALVSLSDLPIERRPDGRAFARHYPERAAARDTEGRVVLLCSVEFDGSFRCTAIEENPVGFGFGAAAVMIAREFRVARQYPDGRPTAGNQVRVPIVFRLG